MCVSGAVQYEPNVLMHCLNIRMIGGNGKKGVGNVLHRQNEKKQNKRSEFQKGGDYVKTLKKSTEQVKSLTLPIHTIH